MSSPPLERAIVASISRHLKKRPQCHHIKTHGNPYLMAGTPDILGTRTRPDLLNRGYAGMTWRVFLDAAKSCFKTPESALAALASQPFALEVKRPGGAGPTPIQRSQMRRWEAGGALAAVVRSTADVTRVMNGGGD